MIYNTTKNKRRARVRTIDRQARLNEMSYAGDGFITALSKAK